MVFGPAIVVVRVYQQLHMIGALQFRCGTVNITVLEWLQFAAPVIQFLHQVVAGCSAIIQQSILRALFFFVPEAAEVVVRR